MSLTDDGVGGHFSTSRSSVQGLACYRARWDEMERRMGGRIDSGSARLKLMPRQPRSESPGWPHGDNGQKPTPCRTTDEMPRWPRCCHDTPLRTSYASHSATRPTSKPRRTNTIPPWSPPTIYEPHCEPRTRISGNTLATSRAVPTRMAFHAGRTRRNLLGGDVFHISCDHEPIITQKIGNCCGRFLGQNRRWP